MNDKDKKNTENFQKKREPRSTTVMPGVRVLDRYPEVQQGRLSISELLNPPQKTEDGKEAAKKIPEHGKSTTPDGSAVTPQLANMILPEEEAPTYSDDNGIPIDMMSPVENTRPTPVILVKDKGAREFFLSAILIALIYFQFKLAKLIEWIKCKRKY